jgi:hypothetical protein
LEESGERIWAEQHGVSGRNAGSTRAALLDLGAWDGKAWMVGGVERDRVGGGGEGGRSGKWRGG